MSTINQSSPPEIIGKVMCGDAVRSAHPFFESTVVGIHVLHVVDLADIPDTCSQIDWAVDDANFPHCGTQCLATISTENCIVCQQWFECRADVLFVSLRLQNVVHLKFQFQVVENFLDSVNCFWRFFLALGTLGYNFN